VERRLTCDEEKEGLLNPSEKVPEAYEAGRDFQVVEILMQSAIVSGRRRLRMPAFDVERIELALAIQADLGRERTLSALQARSFVRCIQTTWDVDVIRWAKSDSLNTLDQADTSFVPARSSILRVATRLRPRLRSGVLESFWSGWLVPTTM
jgi:hypothetical protein